MEILEHPYQPNESFLRVATACPEVFVADVGSNVRNIHALYKEAIANDVSLVTFPELSITGYTIGDLVHQNQLLNHAQKGLSVLAQSTAGQPTAMIVGLPMQVGNLLYNCAAVLANGKIQGIVPKTHRPNDNEFQEHRWFDAWGHDNIELEVGGQSVPFGTNMLFEIGGTPCGVEICEDLWVMDSPNIELAKKGALIIANPSASPEKIGQADYRRNLVTMTSAKLFSAYIYASCDTSESTAEVVMGGHQIIASDGKIQAERQPFGLEKLVKSDIDVEHLQYDRRKHKVSHAIGALLVKTGIMREQTDLLCDVEKNPFLPEESEEARANRLETALQIQAHGLAMRMKKTHQERLVLGLSGGLDSTLALLVARKAATILGRDPSQMIHTLTMPGPASSENTQSNAQLLAKHLGVQNKVIPIGVLTQLELDLLEHDGQTQDVTYENVQARARTNLLFNYGNKNNAMVLGTGDLSEILLGWCTYNADQQSHYNVNGSVPKTLVRRLVAHVAQQPNNEEARPILQDILDTPISPELTKHEGDDISQSTEDIIGPYALHDFFIWQVLRWGDTPPKIQYLAEQAFASEYNPEEINKWLRVFLRRFLLSQFKRDNMPNSPKVGSISASPRGDLRLPSDLYNAALWEDEFKIAV